MRQQKIERILSNKLNKIIQIIKDNKKGEFYFLMKLRFLMSHHRKNSVKDKVIGKKWISLEKDTLHRQSVLPSQELRSAPGYGVVTFYRTG